jgi:hypothetical protein
MLRRNKRRNKVLIAAFDCQKFAVLKSLKCTQEERLVFRVSLEMQMPPPVRVTRGAQIIIRPTDRLPKATNEVLLRRMKMPARKMVEFDRTILTTKAIPGQSCIRLRSSLLQRKDMSWFHTLNSREWKGLTAWQVCAS